MKNRKNKNIRYVSTREIKIKRATLSDFDFYRQINSEHGFIYWSGFKKELSCKELEKKYKAPLLNPKSKRTIYIIYYFRKKAGFFYLDRINKNMVEVAIAVSGKCQGRGLGTKALKKFLRIIRENYNNPKIVAWIFDINTASIKIFTRNGFCPTNKIKRKLLALRETREVMRKYIYKNKAKNK